MKAEERGSGRWSPLRWLLAPPGLLLGSMVDSRLLRSTRKHFLEWYWRSRLGSLGAGSQVFPRVVMRQPRKVHIGRNVSIAEFVHVWGGGGVTIGDDVMIASHAVITSVSHDPGAERMNMTQILRPVTIGHGSWIGAHAVLLPGVTVGPGSVVAAGAVVTGDVAPNSIVRGVPAAVMKVRSGGRAHGRGDELG